SSQRSPKDVPEQFIRRIRLIAARFGCLYEIVIRTGDGVAVILVKRSVERIGTTFRDQCHLGAGSSALIGIVIGSGHAEFLHGIEGRRQHRGKGISAGLIVNVYAVQRNVALVATSSVDRSAAGVLVLIYV